MTKYARDEFDRVPETSTRQGVHRTVSAPRSRRLGPILSFGAAALAIGLVAFLLLPKLGFGPAGGSAMTADQASNNAAASPAPTTAAATPSASSEPTGSLAPAGSTPSASATPSAAVDKTQPVAIYNGTATAGLAGRVGTTVTSAGWVLGPLGNWGGARQQTSVVFYNGPAQKANAEALGSLLGIATLVDSAEFKMPLVVVLGPGFK
ncbi:LytR family transcriptional regulator [Arthrobacter sp. UKPF54-2]|uniref:LytR C-terminal domain-containing protein n=1 Tax=Arthrobacter sp. UKPF54-2 TaxID=2600159 RepID=UPI0011B183D4|nr:LytR C-terminal domain-containing protein [Arthrobacter sp. UKPF54-2]QDY89174.1 LytR family transcriptional regulator [Arthrobacter sp. UKPF54-2]